MAHLGKNLHRLADNELEKAFSDAWSLQHGQTLAYLLSEDNRIADTSERDEEVAATAIQWLGSPVGQFFLRDVFERTDAGRKFIQTLQKPEPSPAPQKTRRRWPFAIPL